MPRSSYSGHITFDDRIVPRLKQDGYFGFSRLGSGAQGTAYLVRSKKHGKTVIKVTEDEKEAKAMALVKAKPAENIVKVYEAWKYKSIPDIFFVEEEKLDPLPEKIDQFLRQPSERKYPVLHDVAQNYTSGGLFDTIEIIKLVFKNEMPINAFLDAIAEQKMQKDLENFCLDMASAADHMLRKLHIKWKDFHNGNVMVKGGAYKILDLGFSESGGKYDVREMKLRDVLETL